MMFETRILSECRVRLMDDHGGSAAPLEDGPSYVRFWVTVKVHYAVSPLGGRGILDVDAEKPKLLRTYSATHMVRDPSIFLDYDSIRRNVWDELVRLPVLQDDDGGGGLELDISPSNWDTFRPDTVAKSILDVVRGNDRRGLFGGHYRFDVAMSVQATLVFCEPKALLRYCSEQQQIHHDHAAAAVGSDPCGICLACLVSPGKTLPVNLPCTHAFHEMCIIRWFYNGATCPLCRHDLRGLVGAPPWKKISKPCK